MAGSGGGGNIAGGGSSGGGSGGGGGGFSVADKAVPLKDDVLLRELAYSFIGKNSFLAYTFKD